jgi:hypothetical protein
MKSNKKTPKSGAGQYKFSQNNGVRDAKEDAGACRRCADEQKGTNRSRKDE